MNDSDKAIDEEYFDDEDFDANSDEQFFFCSDSFFHNVVYWY